MIAQILFVLLSVANFERELLESVFDRVNSAVVLIKDQSRNRTTAELQSELLAAAGALDVIVKVRVGEISKTERPLFNTPEECVKPKFRFNLDDGWIGSYLGMAVRELVNREGMIAHLSKRDMNSGDLVLTCIDTAPLRSSLFNYLGRALAQSAAVSGIAALMVFMTVNKQVSRPIGRLIRHIVQFENNPGKLNKAIVPASNLTDLQRAEKALRSLQIRQGALVVIGTDAIGIEHEVRHLLQDQLNLAEELRLADSESARDTLISKILESQGLTIRFVKSILDFAQSNTLRLEKRDVPIKKLLAPVVERARERAKARALNIVFDTQIPGDPVVNIDSKYVTSAINNLVRNSIEAIGTVYREGENEAHRVSIEVVESEREVVILISDDGPGIDPEVRNLLFNFNPNRKKESNGFGIGLCDARRRIEHHGGSLELMDSSISSSKRAGTTFKITLQKHQESDDR